MKKENRKKSKVMNVRDKGKGILIVRN